MYGKIVIVLKGTHLGALDSYSSSLPISFSFSSTSFNHPWSMHSVHLLPCLNLERSNLVGLSQIISTWGRHRTRRCSSGTQNNTLSSWPSIHPSLMFSGTASCPSTAFWCLAARFSMSWMIGHQLGSISISNKLQKRSWIPTLSMQMAGVDVEESYCVCVSAAKSNQWVTKGLVIQGRWEGNSFHARHCYGLATELTSSYVPDSDVIVLGRTTCKEFSIRWVCRMTKMRFISKVDTIKLGSVMIPWIT